MTRLLHWVAGAITAIWLGMSWLAAELLADDLEDWE